MNTIQQMNIVAFLIAAFGCLAINHTGAATVHRSSDQSARLSDSLAVAKSPFEPVTLAVSLSNEPHAEIQPFVDATKPSLADAESSLSLTIGESNSNEASTNEDAKRTTRSVAQSSFEEQQNTSSTKGLDEGAGLSSSSGATLATQSSKGSSESTTTEEPFEEVTSTESATDAPTESETRVSSGNFGEREREPSTTTTEQPKEAFSSTKTSTPVQTTLATTEESSKPSTSRQTETPITSDPTTTPSSSEGAVTTKMTTTVKLPLTTTTEAPTEITTIESVTTTATATTREPNVFSTNSVKPEEVSTTDSKLTNLAEVQTTPSSQPTESSSSAPTTTSPAPIDREHPVSEAATTTTESNSTNPSPATASTSSTTETSTTSAKPTPSKPEEETSAVCNHLPTYTPDEVQRVFREETTYKNGTIKGKFTYINFDQRYRLVHYTRLPYGPVKIDRVEELGRPQSSAESNQSQPPASPSLNDIPNAVLQLRNLLPNSLFGFPFLGPSSNVGSRGAFPQSAFVGSRGSSEDGVDPSSMYFYSTDSLSTPNLLTPRVPVSLLPGQRVKPETSQSSAVRENSYLAHAPLATPDSDYPTSVAWNGMPASSIQENFSKLQHGKLEFQASQSSSRPEPQVPPANQFQYASSFAHANAPNPVYSFYSSNAYHPAHYKYAPVEAPELVYNQPPSTHSLSGQQEMAPVIAGPSFASGPNPFVLQHHHHQAHQPHSHEHFVAPFMFAQPGAESQQNNGDDNNENNSRLRLKVKTSKALNVGGTKSAQLRLSSSNGHYSSASSLSPAVGVAAHAESPAKRIHRNQHQRQQQRLGKQNQQLQQRSRANQSPVVYHVLRNQFPQYNQGYAVAYDQNS